MQRLQRIAHQIFPLRRAHVPSRLLHHSLPMSQQTSASAQAASSVAAAPAGRLGKLKVACIQMTSGENMNENISACSDLVRQAARAGARLVCTPENTGRMSALTQRAAAPAAADPLPDGSTQAAAATTSASAPTPAAVAARPAPPSSSPPFSSHPVIVALAALAAELDIWILVGSIAVRADADGGAGAGADAGAPLDKRFCNRSVLLAPRACAVDSTLPKTAGAHATAAPSSSPSASPSDASASPNSAPSPSAPSQVVAHYDKIFLFDVPSLNGAETYLESARVRPGSQAVVVDCSKGEGGLGEGAVLGMSVCYDLRFPHLYRDLAQCGATILTIPAAFTVVTGRLHWHALLRARAIETGSFVLAPAQVGTHPGDRRTYGHSLIVDPNGAILADAGGDSVGFITAELDLDAVTQARNRVPSLLHDRPYTIVKRQVA